MKCVIQMDTSEISWYGYIWINCEILLCLYLGLEFAQNALFFTMCTIMGTIVFAGHVIETNKTIWKLIEKYRCENLMLPSIPLPCRMIISNQMFEHNRVTYLVISGSRELFGYILYSYLLTNLPINVYLLRRNVFEQQELEEQLLIWLVILLQLLASMIVFGPLAWCAEVYHSPEKFIPILQPMLRGPRGWLIYKMKYEDLYHRLIDDGPKLAVSIGPVRAITYMASLEVYQFYQPNVAYILTLSFC